MKKIKLLITLSAICTSSLIYAQDHLAPSTMKNPVADIHPDNSYLLEEALVYLKIGNKKVVEKDFHAAAENYTKALEIKHNFKEALKNRGICYTMMNMDEKAIQDFDHAIIIDPDDKSLYSYRGFAKAEAKQFEEALKDLNIAISMDNKFSDAYDKHQSRDLAKYNLLPIATYRFCGEDNSPNLKNKKLTLIFLYN